MKRLAILSLGGLLLLGCGAGAAVMSNGVTTETITVPFTIAGQTGEVVLTDTDQVADPVTVTETSPPVTVTETQTVTQTVTVTQPTTTTQPPPPPPPPPGQGTANVWVDTNGGSCLRSSAPVDYNDANSCASATAAQTVAQPGDTIYFASGTYGQQLVSKAFASYTTFAAAPNATVVLDVPAASDGATAKAFLVGNGANHVRVQGFEMLDGLSLESSSTTDNIEIVGNNIHSAVTPNVDSTWADIASYGIVIRNTKPGSHIAIRDNRIANIAYQCKGNGADANACDSTDNSSGGGLSRGYCIYDFASQNLEISGNRIDGCWEDAYQAHAVNLTFVDNDIANVWNPVLAPGNHQDGIQIFTANPVTAAIERNVWHGNQDTCVRVQNVAHSGYVIRNNVCGGHVHGTGFDLENLSNSTISFNTVVNAGFGSNISQPDTPISGDLIENNIFLGPSGLSVAGTNQAVRNNLVPSYSGVSCVNCFTAAPTFVDAAGEDWRLAAGSVGVDQGVNEPGVTLDVGGRPRPVGVAPDIGAWERQNSDP